MGSIISESESGSSRKKKEGKDAIIPSGSPPLLVGEVYKVVVSYDEAYQLSDGGVCVTIYPPDSVPGLKGMEVGLYQHYSQDWRRLKPRLLPYHLGESGHFAHVPLFYGGRETDPDHFDDVRVSRVKLAECFQDAKPFIERGMELVSVYQIDYGKTRRVPWSSLHTLDPSFRTHPPLGFRAHVDVKATARNFPEVLKTVNGDWRKCVKTLASDKFALNKGGGEALVKILSLEFVQEWSCYLATVEMKESLSSRDSNVKDSSSSSIESFQTLYNRFVCR